VVIAPTARPHEDSVALLRDIPHVQLLRKHPSLGSQWFGLDDHRTLGDATAHLLHLGHTRVAYIGASAELPTGQQRLAGFTQALREGGVSRRANLVELGPPSSAEHGREAVRRLLKLPTAPTAVVLGSVPHTIGVLDELLDLGVDVPNDLSVIGFGDQSAFGWWGPGLTTISLPISDVAASCGLWFVRRLNNPPEQGGGKPYESVSTGSLVLRGSTAPPPAAAKMRSA
jgi:LacI family transcriptional regulator